MNGNGDGPISTITATPADPLAPPTLGEVSVSGTTLTADFEWGGTPPRSVWWELHRSSGQTSGFARVQGPTADSSSPLTFEHLARGYWFQVRGRTCESPSNLPRATGDSANRSPSYVATACGTWTSFSTAELVPSLDTVPANAGSGTPPVVDEDTCDDDSDPATEDCGEEEEEDCDPATENCVEGEEGDCNPATETCEDEDTTTPQLSCTLPQVLNDDGTDCVDPPDEDTTTPSLSCTLPQVLNDDGSACVDPPATVPCDGKVRPADFSIGPVVTSTTATRWITNFVSPSFCIQYEEQQTTTTTTVIRTTYSCDGECYVASVIRNVSTSTGPWRRTGASRTCNFPRSDSAGQYTLSAGVYELVFGEQLVRFTVPDGAQVVLSWRETADGTQEAVLRSGTEQVAIGADALSGDRRDRLTRAGASSTLSSVVSSLRAPATEDTVVTSSETTPCVEIEAGNDGTSAVDLEVNGCAMLRHGGAVTVTSGERSHSFSLAADREWLAVEASLFEPGLSGAVTFVDALSGGYLTLSLSDGSELGRHIPDGDTTLGPLFDAIRAPEPDDSAPAGGSAGQSQLRHWRSAESPGAVVAETPERISDVHVDVVHSQI